MASGTRNRIMDIALRLLAREGFAGTAVTDIEAAAGLSAGSGSFYRHFRSKEDVLLAVVDRELDRLRARQRASRDAPPREAPPGADIRERVAAEVTYGLMQLQELAPLVAILVRDGHRFPELAERVREVVEGGVASGLEAVVEASAALNRDPVATAVVVTAASVGYHLAREFLGTSLGGVEPERFADAVAGLVTPVLR